MGGEFYMKYQLLELRSDMINNNLNVYEMLQEFPVLDEFNQHNVFSGLSRVNTKNLIDRMTKYAYGIDNSLENPKCEHYVLFADNRPVALGCLMLELNDYWKKYRGHFWYKTLPSERRKGFGTILLELLVERARIFGFSELFGQCNIHNVGSNKIMLKNGFERYDNPLCPDNNETNFYKKKL